MSCRGVGGEEECHRGDQSHGAKTLEFRVIPPSSAALGKLLSSMLVSSLGLPCGSCEKDQ